MSDSYIAHHASGGVSLVGEDATRLFAAVQLKGVLKMMRVGMKFRITQRAALEAASRYTGRPYKRNELALAEQHLVVWIETMKSALPIYQESKA